MTAASPLRRSLPVRPVYTHRGYERLLKRIEAARAEYLAVCRSNEEAAGGGDTSVWHDNFAYEDNQRRMHQLAERVAFLEAVAHRATVIPARAQATERVHVGVQVELVWLDSGERARWFIAGWDDGDPDAGRLSYASPLGAAVLGAEAGDTRLVETEAGAREVEIFEIYPAPEVER